MANHNPFQDFHVTIKAILHHRGKFLLLKELAECYEAPGGRVDKQEIEKHYGGDIKEAVNREVFEETGVNLHNIKNFKHVFEVQYRPEGDYYIADRSCLELYYRIYVDDEVDLKVILSEEHLDHIWIDEHTNMDQIKFLNDGHKKIFTKVQRELKAHYLY